MTRSELVLAVKEHNLETARPPHMMKTEDLQALVDNLLPKAKAVVKEVTMKSRILELKEEGVERKEILQTLNEEGWDKTTRSGKIRPAYVSMVLKRAEA